MESTSSPTAKDVALGIDGYTCEECKNYVRSAYSADTPYNIDKLFDAWRRHCKSPACSMRIIDKSRTHTGNGKPQGAFAFTLTKSPEDPLTVGDMLCAVRKVMQQKSCPVKRYAWYYEDKGRDADGDPIHPHIHGMYETDSGGRIERKHWKRAWGIWDENQPIGYGFRGGYHRVVRSEEGYSDYIKKDGGMSESKGIEDQPTV